MSENDLKFIDAFSFKALNQLEPLNLMNNSHLILNENSLYGLGSIQRIDMSAQVLLTHRSNVIHTIDSIKAAPYRKILNRVYYKSINIVHNTDVHDSPILIDCAIVLKFLKVNTQLNLESDLDVVLFFQKCKLFTFYVK